MKNKCNVRLFGIIALAAVIGFSMAACGGGGGGGPQIVTYTGTSSSGEKYTLKITEYTERYTAQNGDAYELTAGSNKSSGTVVNVEGGVLTLRPLNITTTFTATVSGSGLTALNGTITWTDTSTTYVSDTLTGGGSSSGGGSGDGGLGDTLTLSGQVYTQEFDFDSMMSGGSMYKYKAYAGSVETFSSNVGGKGSIKNGKMSFSVGAPSDSLLEPATIEIPDGTGYDGSNIYSDMKIQPSDARGTSLDFSNINLNKENMNMSMSGNNYSMTMEYVFYIYLDRDCTITAKGGTVNDSDTGAKITVSNLNLKLKKGWNLINMKVAIKSATGTVSINTGDLSSCRWVLDGGFDGGDDWW